MAKGIENLNKIEQINNKELELKPDNLMKKINSFLENSKLSIQKNYKKLGINGKEKITGDWILKLVNKLSGYKKNLYNIIKVASGGTSVNGDGTKTNFKLASGGTSVNGDGTKTNFEDKKLA